MRKSSSGFAVETFEAFADEVGVLGAMEEAAAAPEDKRGDLGVDPPFFFMLSNLHCGHTNCVLAGLA